MLQFFLTGSGPSREFRQLVYRSSEKYNLTTDMTSKMANSCTACFRSECAVVKALLMAVNTFNVIGLGRMTKLNILK